MTNINVIDLGHSSLLELVKFHKDSEMLKMSRSCCGYACQWAD